MNNVKLFLASQADAGKKSADTIGNRKKLHRRMLGHFGRRPFVMGQNFQLLECIAKTMNRNAINLVGFQTLIRRSQHFDFHARFPQRGDGLPKPWNFVVLLKARIDRADDQDFYHSAPLNRSRRRIDISRINKRFNGSQQLAKIRDAIPSKFTDATNKSVPAVHFGIQQNQSKTRIFFQ